MSILVLNAGSSSLKFSLFDENFSIMANGIIPAESEQAIERAAQHSLESIAAKGGTLRAVGHRIVHGGTLFKKSVRVTSEAKKGILELSELAPLHNRLSLQIIEIAEKTFPGIPEVAVFDTAFYADLPEKAFVYPLPYAWYEQWGIRRFGFHGINHAYCFQRAGELLGKDPKTLQVISCHLGNGCSATAIRQGKAVATTMGFSPLEGLMMGTRSGSVDPEILLYLLRHKEMKLEDLEAALNESSGLLGVSGIASDCRQVEEAREKGNARARLALDIYAERIKQAIGALAVTLGDADTLIFTGGVGAHASKLRSEVCEGLQCLGFELDPQLNSENKVDSIISPSQSQKAILAIQAGEELMIAHETAALLKL